MRVFLDEMIFSLLILAPFTSIKLFFFNGLDVGNNFLVDACDYLTRSVPPSFKRRFLISVLTDLYL